MGNNKKHECGHISDSSGRDYIVTCQTTRKKRLRKKSGCSVQGMQEGLKFKNKYILSWIGRVSEREP